MREEVIKMHLLSALQLLAKGPKDADDWRYIEHDLTRALGIVRNNIETLAPIEVKGYTDWMRHMVRRKNDKA